MTGFEWSVSCLVCQLTSPSMSPGTLLVCNHLNRRFETFERLERGVSRGDEVQEQVTIHETIGLPPTGFKPPFRCPRCKAERFETQLGGGKSHSIELKDVNHSQLKYNGLVQTIQMVK